jgi:hypothetical protein
VSLFPWIFLQAAWLVISEPSGQRADELVFCPPSHPNRVSSSSPSSPTKFLPTPFPPVPLPALRLPSPSPLSPPLPLPSIPPPQPIRPSPPTGGLYPARPFPPVAPPPSSPIPPLTCPPSPPTPKVPPSSPSASTSPRRTTASREGQMFARKTGRRSWTFRWIRRRRGCSIFARRWRSFLRWAIRSSALARYPSLSLTSPLHGSSCISPQPFLSLTFTISAFSLIHDALFYLRCLQAKKGKGESSSEATTDDERREKYAQEAVE